MTDISEPTNPRWRNERHAAYQAGWNDAIEECARVAEARLYFNEGNAIATAIADAIRALKDKP